MIFQIKHDIDMTTALFILGMVFFVYVVGMRIWIEITERRRGKRE